MSQKREEIRMRDGKIEDFERWWKWAEVDEYDTGDGKSKGMWNNI